MNIVKLSKLQDFTAQSLGMERTLSNVIVNEKGKAQRKSTTNKKRLDTNEFKEQAKIINETNLWIALRMLLFHIFVCVISNKSTTTGIDIGDFIYLVKTRL